MNIANNQQWIIYLSEWQTIDTVHSEKVLHAVNIMPRQLGITTPVIIFLLSLRHPSKHFARAHSCMNSGHVATKLWQPGSDTPYICAVIKSLLWDSGWSMPDIPASQWRLFAIKERNIWGKHVYMLCRVNNVHFGLTSPASVTCLQCWTSGSSLLQQQIAQKRTFKPSVLTNLSTLWFKQPSPTRI